MPILTGVDIIEIERIADTLQRHGERFLRRLYTEKERQAYGAYVPELAVRFAGKEAVSKVLGTGFVGISWREIEILSDQRGKPLVYLHGQAALRMQELGLQGVEISLSHSREYAVAFAVGY